MSRDSSAGGTPRDAPPGGPASAGESAFSVRKALLWMLVPALFAVGGGIVTGRWTEVAVAFGAYACFALVGLVVGVTTAAGTGVADLVGDVLDR